MKLHMDYTRIETQLIKREWITNDHLFFFFLSLNRKYIYSSFAGLLLFILPFCSLRSRLFLPLESVSTTNIFFARERTFEAQLRSYIRFPRSLNHAFTRILDWISGNAKWFVEYPIHQVHLLAHCFSDLSYFSLISFFLRFRRIARYHRTVSLSN